MNNLLAYNDDYNGTRFSSIDYYMTAGTPYYLKIMGYNYSEVWTKLQVKTAETYYRFSADGMTMDIKEPREGETNIQALVYSTGSTTGEIYHYSSSGQWNRSYQYAGIPSDIGMASFENGGDVSGQSINFANIIDIGKYQITFMDSVYDILGMDPMYMTLEDKAMADIGIVMGIVDSVVPSNGQSNKLLTGSVIKAGIFLLLKKSESECETNYYYLKSKVQTEYIIHIASTIAMYGSFSAAATALAGAGIAAVSGGTLFVSTAGTGFPISIVCEASAAVLAEASGVCAIAGVAMAMVSNNSKSAINRDGGKLADIQGTGSLKISSNTLKHVNNNHNPNVYAQQLKYKPQADVIKELE